MNNSKLACSLRNTDLQNAVSQSEKFPRKFNTERLALSTKKIGFKNAK